MLPLHFYNLLQVHETKTDINPEMNVQDMGANGLEVALPYLKLKQIRMKKLKRFWVVQNQGRGDDFKTNGLKVALPTSRRNRMIDMATLILRSRLQNELAAKFKKDATDGKITRGDY